MSRTARLAAVAAAFAATAAHAPAEAAHVSASINWDVPPVDTDTSINWD
ncbi:hypothetical protein [Streptomyces erythrochromogenes]|nr:hypothetical protein OG364_25160 [Streptomyces erythrochromogenes]